MSVFRRALGVFCVAGVMVCVPLSQGDRASAQPAPLVPTEVFASDGIIYELRISANGDGLVFRQLRFSSQFLKHRYSKAGREDFRGQDGFNLDDVSPVTTVDRLARPALLGHGEEEGHGLSDPQNREDWLD